MPSELSACLIALGLVIVLALVFCGGVLPLAASPTHDVVGTDPAPTTIQPDTSESLSSDPSEESAFPNSTIVGLIPIIIMGIAMLIVIGSTVSSQRQNAQILRLTLALIDNLNDRVSALETRIGESEPPPEDQRPQPDPTSSNRSGKSRIRNIEVFEKGDRE